MSRLGRVRLSAGRHVIDRKACFLSLLAQAAVWLRELRVSQHFSTFYGPSVQSMDTQFGARHRRWTPAIHRAAQGRGGPRKRGGGNSTSGVGPEGGEPPPPVLGCYGPERMGNAEWEIEFIDSAFRIPNHTPRTGRTGRYRATRGPAFLNEQPLPVAGSGSGRETLPEPPQQIR